MYEQMITTMKDLAAEVIREVDAHPGAMPPTRQFDYGSVFFREHSWRIPGVVASATLPVDAAGAFAGKETSILIIYQRVNGIWYCTTMGRQFVEASRADVERCHWSDDGQPLLYETIGWIRYSKENGMFSYFSNLAQKELINYEHFDVVETVLKLAIMHEAELEKR